MLANLKEGGKNRYMSKYNIISPLRYLTGHPQYAIGVSQTMAFRLAVFTPSPVWWNRMRKDPGRVTGQAIYNSAGPRFFEVMAGSHGLGKENWGSIEKLRDDAETTTREGKDAINRVVEMKARKQEPGWSHRWGWSVLTNKRYKSALKLGFAAGDYKALGPLLTGAARTKLGWRMAEQYWARQLTSNLSGWVSNSMKELNDLPVAGKAKASGEAVRSAAVVGIPNAPDMITLLEKVVEEAPDNDEARNALIDAVSPVEVGKFWSGQQAKGWGGAGE